MNQKVLFKSSSVQSSRGPRVFNTRPQESGENIDCNFLCPRCQKRGRTEWIKLHCSCSVLKCGFQYAYVNKRLRSKILARILIFESQHLRSIVNCSCWSQPLDHVLKTNKHQFVTRSAQQSSAAAQQTPDTIISVWSDGSAHINTLWDLKRGR